MSSADHHEVAETRERILGAAERLFAEKGFAATSVRDITAVAGCNVAAVNYHFGGKDALYRDVFHRLLVELRGRRVRRVRADMDAAGDAATLEIFLESFANAFMEPMVDEGRGMTFMAMFDREMREQRIPQEIFHRELVEPMLDVTTESLDRLGMLLTPAAVALCMMSVVGQLLHALKAHFRIKYGPTVEGFPHDLNEHIRHIVTFSAAGIRACAAGTECGASC